MSVESVGRKTYSGIRWTLVNAVGEKILSFGTTLVLARILDPAHFGLYALAFVAIDSIGILKNLGLDSAIVQRKDRVEEAADTAFFVQPILGAFFYGLMVIAAQPIAALLKHAELVAPLRALGLIFVVMSFGNVPAALIQKQMRFGLRTAANLAGMLVYAVSAIALALRGAGVFSLITAYLFRWTVSIVIQWMAVGWWPRLRFDPALFREMLHFSKYVVAAWVLGCLGMNMDRLVIGRWLGVSELGYYTLCLGLATLVTSQIGAKAHQVVFPAFANIQTAPEALREGLLKLVKYLLLCALPLAVLLIAAPQDLLHAFYGPRWVSAAPVLQVLAIAGLLETLRIGLDPVLLGCGYVRLQFGLNVLHLIILSIGGAWMAMAGSLVGVAWMVVAASGVPGIVALFAMMRKLKVSLPLLAGALRPVLLSGLIAAGAISVAFWVREPLIGSLKPSGLWLLGMVLVSASAYASAVVLFDRTVIQDFLRLAGAGKS